MTIISYSEVSKYQTCKRQYFYRFGMGLKPAEESGPISTGVKGHKLLERFYLYLSEGMTKLEALELVKEEAAKQIAHTLLPDFNMLKAWTMVDNYIRASEFESTALLIENRFLIAASKISDDPEIADVQIGFTPDLVTQRSGGFIDVEDYKFVQRAWSQKKIDRFTQLKLYTIFLETMGYNISQSRIRFFNVGKEGKDGGGTITTKNYSLKDDERITLSRDFVEGIKDVLRFKTDPSYTHELAPRTLNYTACGFCAFNYVCSQEAQGRDMTKTLDYQFVKSDYAYDQ